MDRKSDKNSEKKALTRFMPPKVCDFSLPGASASTSNESGLAVFTLRTGHPVDQRQAWNIRVVWHSSFWFGSGRWEVEIRGAGAYGAWDGKFEKLPPDVQYLVVEVCGKMQDAEQEWKAWRQEQEKAKARLLKDAVEMLKEAP
jgi:hypothetical protein